MVAGHYLAALALMLIGRRVTGAGLSQETLPTTVAVGLLGAVWWLQRQGRPVPDRAVSRAIGWIVGFLVIVAVWGGAGAAFGPHSPVLLPWPPAAPSVLGVVLLAAAFAHALPAMGSIDTLEHVALDLEQPRIRNLHRTARLVGGFGLLVTAPVAFLFVKLCRRGNERLGQLASGCCAAPVRRRCRRGGGFERHGPVGGSGRARGSRAAGGRGR
jgi:hypothetical protein